MADALTGLSTATQGISERRNHCGLPSHGARKAPAKEPMQALLAAKAAP